MGAEHINGNPKSFFAVQRHDLAMCLPPPAIFRILAGVDCRLQILRQLRIPFSHLPE